MTLAITSGILSGRIVSAYTVTISGREREDGEAPYTWVVLAETPWQAMEKAKEAFHDCDEEAYEEMQVEEIFEGMPPENCGYYFNDVRYR